jgi:Thermostable hemolysin
MDRATVVDLICRKYALVHGAVPEVTYPQLRAQNSAGQPKAALGYRRADAGPLFLEAYLNAPVEQVICEIFGRELTRHDIVEIGNLASEAAPAMVALWARTANDLASEAEVVVAVLTKPLRSMFRRLGVVLHEIIPACQGRLASGTEQWGQYYRDDPVVCAGLIADGQKHLTRFDTHMKANCA